MQQVTKEKLTLFSKRKSNTKDLTYNDLVKNFAKMGVSHISDLEKPEQVLLFSLYQKSLSKYLKVDTFLGDDNYIEINDHLTMLLTGEITLKQFGAWAKKRITNACIDQINCDLESYCSKQDDIDLQKFIDDDRIDRARDLIQSTRHI